MRAKLTLVLIGLLWSPLPVRSADQPKLAVLEFEVQQGLSIDRRTFSSRLQNAARNAAPHLFVMTQANIQMMLRSAGKRLEECEGECAVDTGRLIGADIVIAGRISKVGQTLAISMQMYETAKGQLLAGQDVEARNEDDLLKVASDGAARLLKSLVPPAAAEQPSASEGTIKELSKASGCKIELPGEGCPWHPELKGAFSDAFEGSERDPARCLRRAADFHNYCGSTQVVTATFFEAGKAVKSKSTRRRCDVTFPSEGCPARREELTWAKEGVTFDDWWDGADDDPARCLRRAAEWAASCESNQPVAARFYEDGKLVATQTATARARCKIELPGEGCPKHPEFKGTFNDVAEGSDHDQARCLRRAAEWHNHCGSTQVVTATFFEEGKAVKSKSTRRRCDVTFPPEGCPAHRDPAQTWTQEGGTWDDSWDGGDDDPARCQRRATEWAAHCESTQPVAARFYEDGKLVATQTATARTRCKIELPGEGCPKHPEVKSFNDTAEGSDHDAARCVRRAGEYRDYCASTEPVTAAFYEAGRLVSSAKSTR